MRKLTPLQQIARALHRDALGEEPWYVRSAITTKEPNKIRVELRDGRIATLQLELVKPAPK